MSFSKFPFSCPCSTWDPLNERNPDLRSCPGPTYSCDWRGTTDNVMCHLMNNHRDVVIELGEDIVFRARNIIIPRVKKWITIQTCHSNNFLVVMRKRLHPRENQEFFAAVLLVGTSKQAEKFACRLELKRGRRRFCWEGTPRSFNEGAKAAFRSRECLVFTAAIANHFVDDGNLCINVNISKLAAGPSFEKERCSPRAREDDNAK